MNLSIPVRHILLLSRAYHYSSVTEEKPELLIVGVGLCLFSSSQTAPLQQIYQMLRLRHSLVLPSRETNLEKETVKSLLIRTICSVLFILFRIESLYFTILK